jgi:predicted nuclease of restriction endonuclease-like (RecB) superfamily
LATQGVPGLAARTLRQCRQFYVTYPGIWRSLSAKSSRSHIAEIWQTLSAEFTDLEEPKGKTSPIELNRLVTGLSFSHFAELISIEDPLKRGFYETECRKGNWSVRELKRQIGSLYFERSGLSIKPDKIAAIVRPKAEIAESRLVIRDPYIFEFLGLKSHETMGESDLENSLLDKLQSFLIELGHGFCFEARQKRVLIGDTYGFIDLVFYHRILKCHVLVELKVDEFAHEHLGQLNTYVSWYKRNVMTDSDNPPVGLLLCTRKDHTLVEYALADLPNRLFVSKYQLALPSREQLRRFLAG